MICKNCGAEMPFFAAVCPVCEQESAKNSFLQRMGLLVLAGCLMLGVLLLGMQARPKPAPAEAAPVTASAVETTVSSHTTNKPETTAAPEISVEQVTDAAPGRESVVYVTISGTKYHKSTCSYLRSSKEEITLEEAQRQGYTPCSRCFP